MFEYLTSPTGEVNPVREVSNTEKSNIGGSMEVENVASKYSDLDIKIQLTDTGRYPGALIHALGKIMKVVGVCSQELKTTILVSSHEAGGGPLRLE
jgi:hypothetical protein